MLKQSREQCRVCSLIRTYLLVAVPLLAMLGLSNDSSSGQVDAIALFGGVYLIDFLAYLAGFSLIAVVVYKGYKEFWYPRQTQKKISKLTKRTHHD